MIKDNLHNITFLLPLQLFYYFKLSFIVSLNDLHYQLRDIKHIERPVNYTKLHLLIRYLLFTYLN